MINLLSGAFARISSLLNGLQIKSFLSVVLVGFLLLTTATGIDAPSSNKALAKQVRDQAHQLDSVRPKTTREWYQEGRETDDSLGERIQRIGEESAEAFKEFGSVYPDTAKTSAKAAKDMHR